ncbi:hypothetical protein SAMN02910289_00009 [Lachnospiraceae bacterium RM5]|nr:hypothetical protein SAMN02910289_00009 [Lachnospiraceae bacterium RM5]
MARYFYQDFLFENLPVDERDNPVVEIQYVDEISKESEYMEVSFDNLLKQIHFDKWEKMLREARNKEMVYIIDDVEIHNDEIKEYKLFYLKTYYFAFSKETQCFVVKKINNIRRTN